MSYAKQHINKKNNNFLFLPTPQISVAKNHLASSLYNSVDTLNWRFNSINDVLNTPAYLNDDYYKVKFDVYFNVFESLLLKNGGKAIENSEFWNLPDLQLELCKAKNKNKGRWRFDNVKNLIGHPYTPVTLDSNQNNNIRNSIIHSISLGSCKGVGCDPTKRDETIYSGGEGAYDKTEWGINFLKVNKGKNPSFKIEINIAKYFKAIGGTYGDPFLPINSVGLVTRGVGISPIKNNNKYKYYLRNQVFFFRLSCGKEGSYNLDKNRYDDRVYSDISVPIYIQPVVKTFYNIANDKNSGSDSIICHYKIGLGNRV